MAKPQIIMEVTNKKVGYSWLYNYQSYKLFGPPTPERPTGGELGYQPDKQRGQVCSWLIVRLIRHLRTCS
ncbi:MAG: hypothetical protein HY913_14500 [Desulfomonile tiedjei]|nr:hypothetical protein [Desulfomonile tiedjei]